VSRYQKGRPKTDLDFTEARDNEWQWHQLGAICRVCTSLQTENHASTPPLSFLQAGCLSCRPTNSVKAVKARAISVLDVDVEDVLAQAACLFASFSGIGDTKIHYKLNNIYSRNLTATSSSFYLCSKIKYNILMLPIVIKSFFKIS